MPNPLNFLSQINPFKAYRDPLQQNVGNSGVFGSQDFPGPAAPGGLMGGLRNSFSPPNPGLTPPQAEPELSGPPPTRTNYLERYREALESQPYQEGYSPSKKRMFGGILLGGLAGTAANNPVTAYNMSRSIVRAPYDNAMEQWATTTSGYKDLAKTEQDQNTQDFNNWLKQGQLESLSGYRTGQLDYRNRAIDEKAITDKKRLEIMDMAARGLAKVEYDETTGEAVAFYKDHTREKLPPNVLRHMTIEQRETLASMGAISIVNARGAKASELEAERAKHAKELAEERIKADKAIAEIRSGGGTAGNTVTTEQDPTASEQIKQIQLDIADWKRKNPDYASSVVDDDNGIPQLKISGWFRDPVKDKAAQDSFNSIFTQAFERRKTTRTTTKGAPPVNPTNPPATQPGYDPPSQTMPPVNQRKANKTTYMFGTELRYWDGSGWVPVPK